MDIILDVTGKTQVSSATYRSSIHKGVGLGDVEPVNIWLLKPAYPHVPTAPWEENYAGSIAFELAVTATLDGVRTVLTSVSAVAAAASVAHPSGEWDGWSLDLDVTGTDLAEWLGNTASKDARLELTWIDGSNRTTWVHTLPVHTVASQIPARRMKEYRWTGIDLTATSTGFLALSATNDFTPLGYSVLIEEDTLPGAGGTAYVVACGFSDDGVALTAEIDDSLTDDGSSRAEVYSNNALTAQSGTATHIYYDVEIAATASVTGTITVFGYEEPK